MKRQRFVADVAVAGRTGLHIRCRGSEGQPVIRSREALDTANRVNVAQRAGLLAVADLSVRAQPRWGERVAVVQLMNRKSEGRAPVARILAASQRGRASPPSPQRRQFCAQEQERG